MNKLVLDIKVHWELIALAISNGGEFRLFHKGKSMMPLLREGVDSVLLTELSNEPKKNDIVVYKRSSGELVMHRIVKIKGQQYVMCGDNHSELEYGITRDDILAKVKGVYRADTYIDIENNKKYKKYVKKLPLRRLKIRLIDIPIDHLRHPEKRKHFKKKK